MKRIITLLLLFFTFLSFGQNKNSESNKKQIFETKSKALVLVNDTVDLDKYKNLVIIPGGYLKKQLEKINYFPNIMTRKEFEKDCQKRGLDKDKYNLQSAEGIKNLLSDYGSFIFVSERISKIDRHLREIAIDIPYKGDVFVVEGSEETNSFGISAGTTYLPPEKSNAMLNELVEYIRRNSKTYK